MDELIKAAVAASIGALTKAAAEPALSAGGKVWSWLKSKVSGDAANTAATVEADPVKPSAASKVTGLLQDLLHGNDAAVAELRKLLQSEGGVQAITQTANFTGDLNTVVTAAGSNTISIGRP